MTILTTPTMTDLTALTSRVAALEAAGVNVDTSLRAVDAAIADLDSRTDALEVRATDIANQLGAHISWAALRNTDLAALQTALADRLDADIAALATRLARLEQREQDVAAMLSTLDQAIAAVSTQAPKARDALRVVRGILAKHVGAA